MHRHRSVIAAALILLIALLLSACNRQPTDIFLPVIVDDVTAQPTVLDTPVTTPTDLPVTLTPIPSPTPADTAIAPTATPLQTVLSPTAVGTSASTPEGTAPVVVDQTPSTAVTSETPSAVGIILPTPGNTRVIRIPPLLVSATPISITPVQVTTPAAVSSAIATVVPTVIPTAISTPTRIFRNYLALIVSQLQQGQPLTATPVPAPIIITPSPPTLTPTLSPTATSGTPPATVTPFTGNIRLLPRDPVAVAGILPVVAYVDPDNVLQRDWSSFYDHYPNNGDFVRIYAGDESRIYGPALALTTTEQWAEGVCMVPSTLVGVQFWGDENDGWARVLVDGVERWRGNTYGVSPQLFVRFLEISNLPPAPHVIRIEPLGERGINIASGNIHVSVYAVVCGLPVESEIFVPILQR